MRLITRINEIVIVGGQMKGIKVGVIVKKQYKKNKDNAQCLDNEQRKHIKLRAIDPEAHQKFIKNFFPYSNSVSFIANLEDICRCKKHLDV